METFTTQDLIEELRQHHLPVEPRREGGITIHEWAKEQGIGAAMAGLQLRGLVDKGVLVRENNRCADGRIRFVYYRNEKD